MRVGPDAGRWAAGRETRIHADAARFEIERAYADRVRTIPRPPEGGPWTR